MLSGSGKERSKRFRLFGDNNSDTVLLVFQVTVTLHFLGQVPAHFAARGLNGRGEGRGEWQQGLCSPPHDGYRPEVAMIWRCRSWATRSNFTRYQIKPV
ncbi:hypothetical protein chiPu_0008174 [Chiloscyllium punctatum]|uniref:Uncharacterized protein n=1 Tax=Chiloscyllium punctatum TaxID=137246 RepID=A0A401SH49_CHIPU|nr:hypothetical protein [Chiloscyllium punctatum]